MFSLDFWKDAADRAVRTAAQVVLTVIGADGAGVISLDFSETSQLALGAAVASILTSVVSVGGPEKAIGVTLPGNKAGGNHGDDAK